MSIGSHFKTEDSNVQNKAIYISNLLKNQQAIKIGVAQEKGEQSKTLVHNSLIQSSLLCVLYNSMCVFRVISMEAICMCVFCTWYILQQPTVEKEKEEEAPTHTYTNVAYSHMYTISFF